MENLVLSCLESRIENNRNLYGRFLLGPFMSGHGITIATALRRALLSEIKGVAITALEIQEITHEFSIIEGVRESVLDIALNFQKVVLHSEIDLTMSQVGYLQIQGPAVVRAMDLKLPLGIQCVDPTQYIATLSTGGLLVLKFLIARGNKNSVFKKNNKLIKARHIKKAKAFYKEKWNKDFNSEICFRNIILLDSMFTPVHRVNFLLESDDLCNKPRERLVFEVWTNGSIQPRQAIHEAALSLIDLFSIFRKISHLDSHSSLLSKTRKLTTPFKKNKLLYSELQKDRHTLFSRASMNTEKKLLRKAPPSTLQGRKQGRTECSRPHGPEVVEPKEQGKKEKVNLSKYIGGFDKPSLQQGKALKTSNSAYKVRLIKILAFLYKTNFDKRSFLSLDLSNLSLSLKTYTLLKQNGIHTIDELLKYSPKELLELVNRDKQMFYNVKNCIVRLGLQVKK